MVKKVNTQEFKDEAMNAPVAVVDFSATWCGPCRMLAPVLEDISEKLGDKVSFYNVDVDDDGALAAGFAVRSITSDGVVATMQDPSCAVHSGEPLSQVASERCHPTNTKPLSAAAFKVTFLPLAHCPLPVTLPAFAGSASPRM